VIVRRYGEIVIVRTTDISSKDQPETAGLMGLYKQYPVKGNIIVFKMQG